MTGAEYRPDDLAALRRRLDRMDRQLADQSRRAPLRSSSISDEDGNIIVRFNPNGLQFLHPTTGNEVAAFAGENLTFRDDAGNALAQLDESGVHVLHVDGTELTRLDNTGTHVFDTDGNEITTIDDDGLTVADDTGTPQLRAGNLDGAGDYGVEIGGGRARAMDIETQFVTVEDASLTTTLGAKATINIVPPAWATTTLVFAWMVFQMHNPTAGVVGQRYRIDFEGDPGTGSWQNDVQPGGLQNVSEMSRDSFLAPFPANITVDAIAGVHTGTNDTNTIRLFTQAIFLR